MLASCTVMYDDPVDLPVDLSANRLEPREEELWFSAYESDTDADGLFCPEIRIGDHKAHFLLQDDGESGMARHVAYRASLIRVARSCGLLIDRARIDFAFSGRVVIEDHSGGDVTLPVRVSLIWRDRHIVWSRRYDIRVNVPEGSHSGFFAREEKDMTYRISSRDLSDYHLDVSFVQ